MVKVCVLRTVQMCTLFSNFIVLCFISTKWQLLGTYIDLSSCRAVRAVVRFCSATNSVVKTAV